MNTKLIVYWESGPDLSTKSQQTNKNFEIPLGALIKDPTLSQDVNSVNGKKGDVELSYLDVGADQIGAAQEVRESLGSDIQHIEDDISGIQQEIDNLSESKLDKVDFVQHFRGLFSSLEQLSQSIPVGHVGDYAHVDLGAGQKRKEAIWDSDDSDWVLTESVAASSTDEVPEGSLNLYFNSDRVRQTPLTGLSIPSTKVSITASDNLITALGKLQASIDKSSSSQEQVWVDIMSVGTKNANITFPAFYGMTPIVEVSRYNGYLWVRGSFVSSGTLGVSAPFFTITDINYKIYCPVQQTSADFAYSYFPYVRGSVNGNRNAMSGTFTIKGAATNTVNGATSIQSFLPLLTESETGALYTIPETKIGKLLIT